MKSPFRKTVTIPASSDLILKKISDILSAPQMIQNYKYEIQAHLEGQIEQLKQEGKPSEHYSERIEYFKTRLEYWKKVFDETEGIRIYFIDFVNATIDSTTSKKEKKK